MAILKYIIWWHFIRTILFLYDIIGIAIFYRHTIQHILNKFEIGRYSWYKSRRRRSEISFKFWTIITKSGWALLEALGKCPVFSFNTFKFSSICAYKGKSDPEILFILSKTDGLHTLEWKHHKSIRFRPNSLSSLKFKKNIERY